LAVSLRVEPFAQRVRPLGFLRRVHMKIIDNRALQFTTRKASQITTLIPRSKVLATQGDKAQVLVNWGLDEWRILRNLGIKNLPHPILGRYKWPGMYTPFDHQRTTAAFMATHQRCFVFNEQGTAKTASAAWAADYLMSKGVINRVLVVCPVSIMDTAWRADLFRTLMHRTVGIAQGTREQRAKVLARNYEFTIINFDGVKTMHKTLLQGGFDLIIVDEATQVKTTTTERWKCLASLVKPNTWVWAMTGTPAAQSPLDAFGLAKLVVPDNVPRFYSGWRDLTMLKLTEYKWVPKQGAKELVHRALQPAIRYTKAECLDLPDMLYTAREVAMTPQQSKYYEMLRKQMITNAAGVQITAQNAAGQINKLAQVAQGSAYADDGSVVDFDIESRFKELLDVITNSPRKTLVFVPYRHVLARIEAELRDAPARVRMFASNPQSCEVAHIHGGTPAAERAEIIKDFQSQDRLRVLLLQPQATAHGITLTRADQVVWWGPVDSVEIYLQANARVHRAGQTNKVTVVHLQGSPIERKMYSRLQGNVAAHMSIVDLYNQEIA
jgi:SNF2 family DNA or RNA helicase